MERPSYLMWLIEEDGVILDNGKAIKCYKLDYSDDEKTLDAWAVHIRRHYISDADLEESCNEIEINPEEYLKKFVIPQIETDKMAGTARSNGISEILFSDLMEFVYDFEVPRCRMYNMSGKTLSEHGTDVIGYKFHNADKTANVNDRLDEFRLAQSLDFMRKKLISMNKRKEAKAVLRFQKKTAIDYKIERCAAGMSSLDEIPEKDIEGSKVKIIPEISGDTLRLKGDAHIFYVHGKRLMELAHKVYDRCVR